MGATPQDIQISYDVGNEFFRLWLDEAMNYTCAMYEGDESLETAQRRKLAWLHNAAGVRADTSVLDIGCGWGACLYALAERGVARAHGITLSPAQIAEIQRQGRPGVTAEVVSYTDYAPAEPFDAVISIGMLEHVVSPEQFKAGEALAGYRRYFEKIHSFCKPGARFGLQTIIFLRYPEDRNDLREIAWTTRTIFPGSLVPRLEDLTQAMYGKWEILELKTGRDDYRRTTEAWRKRLRANETTIRQTWGDALYETYDRYLTNCMMAF